MLKKPSKVSRSPLWNYPMIITGLAGTRSSQCHGFAPRSGPLGSPPDTLQAYSLTLQCPFDVCSSSYGLPRRRIYGKSPLVHYLPSRRNRQCSGIPAGHNKFLHSDIFAALKQFCVLVVVFLVLRVVSDTALYVCRSPFHFKSMPCRTVPPSCESSEPTPTTAAVLRFVSDQIKLANSIAMSSTSLGLGFHELLEEDQANLKALQRTSLFTERSHLLYGRGLSGVNVTELLYTPLIDFTPRGFIGRTFTYALDELERLCTLPCPDYSYTRGEDHSIRALAVYHRISSTLLLEYSAAQPRVIRLLDALQTTRRLVSMVAQRDDGPQVYETRRSWRRRNDYTFVTQQEAFSRLLARLDATIERLSLLVAHLDRITEELSSVPEKLASDRKIELSACLDALRNLFARSILPPGHHSSALSRNVHDVSSLAIRRMRATFSLIHVVGVT